MDMRTGIVVDVTPAARERLAAIVANRNSPQKHVWRARIVLLTAAGCGTAEIMREANVAKSVVWRWQERFMQEGVDGLLRDKTRPSRIPPLPPGVAERVVALTLGPPPGERTHWTAGAMAERVGISVSSVQRIWRAHGLQPHRIRQFKLSNDPSSPPSCAISSASTSTRRRTPWCCRSTKRARSRRSTARSPDCRSNAAAAAP
jgi:transposase